MVELFGFPLGTVFQGGTLAAMLAMLAIVARSWIIGAPDRKRANTEHHKHISDVEEHVRSDLLGRVAALEAEVVSLRQALDRERDRHATEMADIMHELANETQSLDSFILLAEANPDRVLEQIPKIKEMRQAHRERVAMRRGAREGAKRQQEADPQ